MCTDVRNTRASLFILMEGQRCTQRGSVWEFRSVMMLRPRAKYILILCFIPLHSLQHLNHAAGEESLIQLPPGFPFSSSLNHKWEGDKSSQNFSAQAPTFNLSCSICAAREPCDWLWLVSVQLPCEQQASKPDRSFILTTSTETSGLSGQKGESLATGPHLPIITFSAYFSFGSTAIAG